MKLITDTAEMDTAISSIQRRGKKLDTDIHVLAVSSALHAAVHGDATYCNKLVTAMPKGSRVNALREWFEQFAPVAFDAEEGILVLNKGLAAEMRKSVEQGSELPLYIAAGLETPWYDCKKEPPYQPMDLTAAVQKLIKEATKRATADKGDKIDAGLLAKLEGLVPAE